MQKVAKDTEPNGKLRKQRFIKIEMGVQGQDRKKKEGKTD